MSQNLTLFEATVDDLPAINGASVSLGRILAEWVTGQTMPEEALRASPETIRELRQWLADVLSPAGPEATLVVLERLFAVLPMPGTDREDETASDPLAIWIETFEVIPARILSRAAGKLIKTWKYSNPPLPGDLTRIIDRDPDHQRWTAIRARLAYLENLKRGQAVNRERARRADARAAEFYSRGRVGPGSGTSRPEPSSGSSGGFVDPGIES